MFPILVVKEIELMAEQFIQLGPENAETNKKNAKCTVQEARELVGRFTDWFAKINDKVFIA